LKACANVGRPTLAMLVPSEDSSIDSDKLVSTPRSEAEPEVAIDDSGGKVVKVCPLRDWL
jgi:hypothetical protein